jgi:diguanylate cyclase (GGDEF)-like protein
MKKILIVEDSRLFSNLLAKRIVDNFQTDCVICTTYRETVTLLEDDPDQFLLAVLDLTLPDSADGEVVDFVLAKGIPAVVVTARMDDQTREKILAQQILDYIMKGPHILEQLTATISRYLRNQETTLLLVDDSNLARKNIRKILESQNYNILEATDGVDALKVLKKNPDTTLVITDYQMPRMDGFELTAEIRKFKSINQLAIIGVSAHGNPLLSSQFLKRGANDFLNKPYFEEELIWRVKQNVELVEHIAQLRDAAIKDPLTHLYNRRYFFDTGEKLFANAQRKNLDITIAMIDIDHFKNINDTYGHGDGDTTLVAVASTLQESFRQSDIVARFGGEEFIVLMSNMAEEHLADHFETVRQKIAALEIKTEQHNITVSVSIGVTTTLQNSLDKMVQRADDSLYQAKRGGRNRVVIA